MNEKMVLMNEWMDGVCSWVCEWGTCRSWALCTKKKVIPGEKKTVKGEKT